MSLVLLVAIDTDSGDTDRHSLLLDEALHTLAHGVPLVRERDRDAVPCLVLDHDRRGEARGERLGL